MKLSFKYQMSLTFDFPIKEHYFSLNVEPINDDSQRLYSYECEILPCDYYHRQLDWCGNYNYSGSSLEEHNSFGFSVSGTVFTSDTLVKASNDISVYKYPSNYTGMSSEMVGFLDGISKLFNHGYDNLQKADLLMEHLHKYLTYTPMSTTIYTKAHESFSFKVGVCQDYSHIFIAMLRHLRIPSRYVSGLMYENHEVRYGATHAWVEVYQDGFWYGYDPTNCCHTNQGYVAFVKGRDYQDCYIDKGIFKGNASQQQCVEISIKEC